MIDEFLSGLFGGGVKEVGIGGFTTYASVSREISLTSQVPTTYLESGSFANDHVINEPIQLRIDGVVSDITLTQSQFDSFIDNITGTLGSIGIYIGGRTPAQVGKVISVINDARNYIRRIDNIIQKGSQLLDLFGNNTPEKSIKEKFVDSMFSLRESRQPISIDMPYRTFENMVITSCVITEGNSDKGLTFSLTAQQIRFNQILLVEAVQINPSSGVKSQTAKQSDKGAQQGGTPTASEEQSIISVIARG